MHNNSPDAIPALHHSNDVRTREKLEGGKRFVMQTEFSAAGDQPTAIKELTNGVLDGERDQVLLGATGTGKCTISAACHPCHDSKSCLRLANR